MTDFLNAGDTGENDGGEATSFNADSTNAQPSNSNGDNDVVFEAGGRKYTRADLLKKITHADSHIDSLTKRLDEQASILDRANAALEKQITAAELLKKAGSTPPAIQQGVEPVSNQQIAPTAEEITTAVLSKIDQGRRAAQLDSNWTSVTSALTRAYGDNVNQMVQQVAQEAGLTMDEAVSMARSTPQAFLKLFPDPTQRKQMSGIGNGAFNTQSFSAPKAPTTKMWAESRGTAAATKAYLDRLNIAVNH
jgi:hypothetical protein